MNTLPTSISLLACLAAISLAACTPPKPVETTELKHYPVDTMEGIVTTSGVEIDLEISDDGKGSLRVTGTETTTYRLYELGDLDIENTRLIYRARLRTEEVEGKVYIEMFCHFPGKGEFFSRALQSPLSGSNEWTSQETPFFLKTGENPDNIRLNLVVEGKGTVWIDNIQLLKAPL